MAINPEKFRIAPGKKVHLSKLPTVIKPLCGSKDEYQDRMEAQLKAMRPQQEMLYANDSHALLILFQAMDAAGKDGAIKHVLSGLNPQGCEVHSFEHPTARELDHDFLWRTTQFLPERGRIGIFNRSYYEEVLIVRVEPEILLAQRLPGVTAPSKKLWEGRYRSIVDHEAHLHRNGTRILKFFLHLSREEQRKRFLSRIDIPEKNWKFNPADLKARAQWDQYQKAYAECLSATSTKHAPWYSIPADRKEDARLLISEVILNAFHELKLKPPTIDPSQQEALRSARKKLLAEG
jgi:PPK2 family polyphosphate:nucleotide phosphotransferase